MTVLQHLSALAGGGVSGLQAAQRDWSPFVAHFTKSAAMKDMGSKIQQGLRPADARESLEEADKSSSDVFTSIMQSKELRASSPSDKDGVPKCVCLSECTIDGVLSHSQRYGRFGFVFRKADVFKLGGRPCIYLGVEQYGVVAKAFRPDGARSGGLTPEEKLFGLANVYSPPGSGKIQDFTHEREWRVFEKVDLQALVPVALLVPTREYLKVAKKGLKWDLTILVLDELFEWGA